MQATAEGLSEHPLSARIAGWLGNHKEVDQRLLEHAWGVFVPELEAYALHFLAPDDPALFGEVAEQPPVDQYARWQEV
jgi:hypothetical protein